MSRTTKRITPTDLQAYLGVYRTNVAEWVLYGFAIGITGVMFFGVGVISGKRMGLSPAAAVLLGAVSVAVAVSFVIAQARALIVLEPNRISYVIAVPLLSWSISWSDITRCELIERRAKVLRISTATQTRTLVFPSHLWARLRPAG